MGTGRLILTVLGCDGSYPGPGGACSGYLLQGGGRTVWVDAGSGTMANLQRYVRLQDLDAVVVTHEHPDHWSDLEGLAIAFKWGLQTSGPRVYAPPGIRELMRVGAAADVFEWHGIDWQSDFTLGGLRFRFSPTDHPVPTYAVRVDCGGRFLIYSADTGPEWQLSSLGRDADLALCEATFLSDREGSVQHLSARQAGMSAANATVRRLVITHLSPTTDRDAAQAEASEAFGSDILVAAVASRYEI